MNKVPLQVALAWIWARDEDLATHLLGLLAPDVTLELEKIERQKNIKLNRFLKGIEEAWVALLSVAESGEITLYGQGFEKSPHIKKSKIGEHGVEERDVVPNGPPLPIRKRGRDGRDRLSHLKLARVSESDSCEHLLLKPASWLSDGGWWFKNVEVEWDHLRELFPATPTETASDHGSVEEPTGRSHLSTSETSGSKGRIHRRSDAKVVDLPPPRQHSPEVTPKERFVLDACDALFPQGVPIMPRKTRNKLINAWIKEYRWGDTVSPKTIERALSPKGAT